MNKLMNEFMNGFIDRLIGACINKPKGLGQDFQIYASGYFHAAVQARRNAK